MPTAIKQRPQGPVKPVARTGGGVLSRISPIGATKVGRLKLSLYGLPKTGKTRLACTFPKPLLIIGSEDGTASVVGTKGVEFVQLQATDEVHELTDALRQGRWKSVVIDNATKMREMRITELFAAKGMDVPERKPFLYADKVWKDVWVQCSQDLRKILGAILDLPREVELNVVIIAQEQTFTGDDDGASSNSDLIKPAIGSALGKSLCMFINAECDYICQTFIRAAVEERPSPVKGAGNQKVKTGKHEFCLRVGPHETYITGFRMPLGMPDPPDVLVDPSYDKIIKLIRGQ